jgi:chaperonin GroES
MPNKNSIKTSKITPLGDRVLVRPMTVEEVKGGGHNHFGIIIPESVSKEKSAQGIVISVGQGRFIEGKLVPINVKVGDLVIFSKYSYDEVEENGEELFLLREDNLLAVIKE